MGLDHRRLIHLGDRRLLVYVLLNACAVSFMAFIATRVDAASPIKLDELVAVTEDWSDPLPGCDAISVLDAGTGESVYHGVTKVSPGRLAATTDMSIVLSPQSNGAAFSGAGDAALPFLSVIRSVEPGLKRWSTGSFVGEDYARYGGIAVVADDSAFIVGTAKPGGPTRPYVIIPNLPPYRVVKYPIPDRVSDEARPGRALGTATLGGVAEVILAQPGSDLAHILAGDDRVYSIDTSDMTLTGPPIDVAPMLGEANRYVGARIDYAHASLSADGQFLVSNRGPSNELNVVDLVNRASTTHPLSGDLEFVGGVAINKGWENRAVVAVHAIDRVVTYRMVDSGDFVELARISIPPPPTEAHRSIGPNEWDATGPKFSIAWTGSGARLVAATDSGTAEFVVIRVTEAGRHLEIERELTACRQPQNRPLGIVTLNGLISPPPDPTPSASPSPQPSQSPTPSRVPTSTPSVTVAPTATSTNPVSPTASPTPPPAALYLPALLRERCDKTYRRVDAMLVIDASSSMLDLTSAGRSKLDAAREAASALLAELDFSAGDLAGLVVFNATVTSVVELTSDNGALARSLSEIAAAPGTCIPCGVEVAVSTLFRSEQVPTRVPVLVLLTDGESNLRPISEAIGIANRAKGDGAIIFTVGLGGEVEAEALRAIASGTERYYGTTDAEALKAIFQSLVTEIPCPRAAFWPGRFRDG